MDKSPCVYMLASRLNGTLYVGVTGDLPKRIWKHRTGVIDGFTKRYRAHRIVYHEMHGTMEAAITREKQIKEWKRAWKVQLIQKGNPQWFDLYDEFCRLANGPRLSSG